MPICSLNESLKQGLQFIQLLNMFRRVWSSASIYTFEKYKKLVISSENKKYEIHKQQVAYVMIFSFPLMLRSMLTLCGSAFTHEELPVTPAVGLEIIFIDGGCLPSDFQLARDFA